ncbi:copper resistance protein CopC [Leucobacter sp. USCH14]|uniref:copper resistance CopC family protein n=1 Tax=Leucobacter sp. USCH14 TaxID=3024838 RepID=UPI0030B6FFE9
MSHTASTRTSASHPHRSARGLRARITAIVLAVSAMVLGTATPAFAHDQLLSSEPAEAAELTASPTEVTLEFSNSVLTVGAVILLVDQDGTDWTAGEPVLDGPVVSAPIDGELPDGAYEVRWRVVSSDGHPISGIVPFTVGDAVAVGETLEEEPERSSASTSGSEGTATVEAPVQASAAAPGSGESANVWRTVAIGAAGAGGALLIFAAWVLVKRSRRTSSDQSS